jgi:putative alpha-1,2-mannosidase
LKIYLKEDKRSWRNYFYEASFWTYTFFVPHQVNKLIELSGGNEELVKKLNYGMQKGLVEYEKEPAFLAAHLFHYVNRPDLASYWVHHLMDNKFTLKGYPGNEDSGAMGSWFVFSAIGFFPNSGQDLYYFHGPKFEKTIIGLQNNKQIVITAENASSENIYVHSCTFNGKEWDQSWFRQDGANGFLFK